MKEDMTITVQPVTWKM